MGTKTHLPFRLHTHRTGTIYVRWPGVDKSTGTKDPLAALARAQEMYAGRGSAPVAQAPSVPILPLADAWLRTAQLVPATTKIYYSYAKAWDSFFTTLDAVPARVEEYSYKRLAEVMRKSVRKELSALRMFTRWCVREKRLAQAPVIPLPPRQMRGVRVNESRKRTGKLLTREQVSAVLANLPELSERRVDGERLRVRDFFIVLYETGLRPATVERLTVKNLQDGMLYVQEGIDKIRYERILPLSPVAREALTRASAERGPAQPIFGSHDYRKALDKAASQAGLEGVSDYDFRHSRATHLLEAGGTLPGTAFLLGHRQVSTTARYAKPNERAAKETLEKMT